MDVAGSRRDDPNVVFAVHVAVVEPVSQKNRIAPGVDDVPLWIKFEHRRRKGRPIEVVRYHILPVEDEYVIPVIDAHPAQATGEPTVTQW